MGHPVGVFEQSIGHLIPWKVTVDNEKKDVAMQELKLCLLM